MTKHDIITHAGYLGIAAAFVATLVGVSHLADRSAEPMNLKTARVIADACADLAVHAGVPVVVRDGTGRNLLGEPMPVDAACWAKGRDGQWRQIDQIAGPIADSYPKGLAKAYAEAISK